MIEFSTAIIIAIVCMIGSNLSIGFTIYKMGFDKGSIIGVDICLDYLKKEGFISIDNDGTICKFPLKNDKNI